MGIYQTRTSRSVIFQVVLVFQVLTHSSAAEFREDYKYFEETTSFYKIHSNPQNWLSATKICGQEGAQLFYPENECEANVVRRWWNETQTFTEVFIGVTNPYKKIYETIDGQPLDKVYHKWDSGEPNNEKYKKCVLFEKESGALRSGQCNNKVDFICKKKIASPLRNASCDNAEDLNYKPPSVRELQYTLLPDTKHYYKMFLNYSTWDDAKETCESEKATLFFPENECEKNAVIDFWNGTNSVQPIFVGLSNLMPLGDFETIDGRPIFEVYNKWGQGEPNNADGTEGCGVLRLDGTLNDEPCTKKFLFICKKTNPTKEDVPCNKVELKQQTKPDFFRNDYTYLEETKTFYKIHNTFNTWHDAKRKCSLEGAKLYYPGNEKENNVILTYWNETKQPMPFFYIGVSDLLSKEDFETIDGRPIQDVYNEWGDGEPNNAGNKEDCVVLRIDGTINDDRCDKKFPFICEKDRASVNWNDACKIADTKYVYKKEFNKCYKTHVIPRTWTDAYAECTSEQSYLTIINSKDEANFLVELVDNYLQNDNFSGYYYTNKIHIGIHNRDKNGWRTIKGQPLFLTGYDEWDSNQPDSDKSDLCGTMQQKGTLSNVDCSEKSFFVCEHDLHE